MFVPVLLQAQTVAPEEQGGGEYAKYPLLTLEMKAFIDCSYWHYSTVQLQLATAKISAIYECTSKH